MTYVAVYPTDRYYLQDKLFSKNIKLNRDDSLKPWIELRKYLQKKDVKIETIDVCLKNKHNPDVAIIINYPPNTLKRKIWEKFKGIQHTLAKVPKKILIQFEGPTTAPYVYLNIEEIAKQYNKVYVTYKLKGPNIVENISHITFPQPYNTVLKELWKKTDRLDKIVAIYSNKKQPNNTRSLYEERLKAMEYFSKYKMIDLYGIGWEKSKIKYIKKIYKGSVTSKHKTLSKYTFSLCYENTEVHSHITEKIFDCLYVGTIPIYLGAPDIHKYVDKKIYIDARKFSTYRELKEYIQSLSKEDIEEIKIAGKKYLHSKKFQRFTTKFFIKTLKKEIDI